MTGRSELKVDLSDLNDFEPAKPTTAPASKTEPHDKNKNPRKSKRVNREKKRIAAKSYFPSREADDRDQLNIGVSSALKKRFKDLSDATGLRHYALLEQALDAFEREAEGT